MGSKILAPPSIKISAPVINFDLSEARNTARFPISSGVPGVWIGHLAKGWVQHRRYDQNPKPDPGILYRENLWYRFAGHEF